MRHLSIRELDEYLLNDGRIEVVFGRDSEILECKLQGRHELVPSALFTIYLDNGLIGKLSGKEFAVTTLGRERLRRH